MSIDTIHPGVCFCPVFSYGHRPGRGVDYGYFIDRCEGDTDRHPHGRCPICADRTKIKSDISKGERA